jgi:3-hydroxyisobutyrate dehydrogenase
MANIGFIGLGHMGLPMAINLIKHGHHVTGYDLQKSALSRFAAAGGIAGTTLSDCAKEQDVVITMLQTGQQVLGVCLGDENLLDFAKPNMLFIDCSTIDVESSKEMHQLAGQHQLLSLDAPVSGGVAAATAGSLTFMVGGAEEAFARAKPILSCMGQKIIHTGEASSGQVAKICNNMILGVSMIAISEAFILAKNLGLSEQKLFEVTTNASGQCWAMSKYVPVPGVLEQVPANHDYQPGFAAAMMLKDLNLSQHAALNAKTPTPLGSAATKIYQQFIDEGKGQLDFSAIIKLLVNQCESGHE